MSTPNGQGFTSTILGPCSGANCVCTECICHTSGVKFGLGGQPGPSYLLQCPAFIKNSTCGCALGTTHDGAFIPTLDADDSLPCCAFFWNIVPHPHCFMTDDTFDPLNSCEPPPATLVFNFAISLTCHPSGSIPGFPNGNPDIWTVVVDTYEYDPAVCAITNLESQGLFGAKEFPLTKLFVSSGITDAGTFSLDCSGCLVGTLDGIPMTGEATNGIECTLDIEFGKGCKLPFPQCDVLTLPADTCVPIRLSTTKPDRTLFPKGNRGKGAVVCWQGGEVTSGDLPPGNIPVNAPYTSPFNRGEGAVTCWQGGEVTTGNPPPQDLG